ncbi:hypothetical protein PHJA_001730600 [Phtheirospermum japonicum]|uniref:Uncharacterized protein n=1 Tax=Phtheirospermum japonicum TaxID=374723 RepID=A0A830CHR3_9LAMI|nr:hypothetical protein PHJA_001730600 [Phtheirospermum japonicum]
MAKFNVVQKRQRAAIATQKRQVHGDPASGKLHQKIQPHSISGKHLRKLLRKWRRDQKEAAEKGLITMQDVEMVDSDGDLETSQAANKTSVKFAMKKSSKLRVKQLKNRGKNQKKSQKNDGEVSTPASADSMVE